MHLSQLAPQKCGRCSASTFVVVANGEVSLRYLFMQESCRTGGFRSQKHLHGRCDRVVACDEVGRDALRM
jgi:hypothetical protein